MKGSDDLSIETVNILNEAEERIAPYINIENNKAHLTISSGSQINISEQLFRNIVQGINISNQKIESGELFLIDNKLYDFNDAFRSGKLPRLRKSGETVEEEDTTKNYTTERENHWWGWEETTTYNQEGANEYYNTYNEVNSFGTAIAGVAALGLNEISPALGLHLELYVSHRVLVQLMLHVKFMKHRIMGVLEFILYKITVQIRHFLAL